MFFWDDEGSLEVEGDEGSLLLLAAAGLSALSPADFELLEFCAAYYQRPLGETIHASLPPRLRQARRRAIKPAKETTSAAGPFESPIEANAEQAAALARIREGFGRFHPVLLAGITGSGKTEVYLRLIAEALAQGRQALYLVPEIGLTPQLESRVRGRFGSSCHFRFRKQQGNNSQSISDGC